MKAKSAKFSKNLKKGAKHEAKVRKGRTHLYKRYYFTFAVLEKHDVFEKNSILKI